MSKVQSPWIRTVSLNPPSLQDNTADADRLIRALKSELKTEAIDIDPALLKTLPDSLRKWEYKAGCILFKDRYRWLLTGVIQDVDSNPVVGLAVDLGTTRVALGLLDLKTGRPIAESVFDNPQESVGPDILTRVHHAGRPEGLKALNALIISGLNRAIAKLCRSCKVKAQDIHAVTIAGNTVMTHLFMGLNPYWIIREPYIPVVNKPGIMHSRTLGLRANPQARVLIFPNVGSYFGGDLIAGILFSGLYRDDKTAILVDVGTNAEVVVGNRNWLMACAGAAGPALESGAARIGTTAGPGVIDKIAIHPNSQEFEIHTIEDLPARGICGSGVIDLAAQLFLAGMIDIRGKLVPQVCGKRLKAVSGIAHLVVVSAGQSATGEDLTFSQVDLDSLIRSKAAMYTILRTITASVGVSFNELERFYVAGTFGSFINPGSAITIGMLPDLPLERYIVLGNSSLAGAILALQSHKSLEEIDRIRDHITYMELNVNQEFMNRFSAAKFLPHTDPARFPSVKVNVRQKDKPQ